MHRAGTFRSPTAHGARGAPLAPASAGTREGARCRAPGTPQAAHARSAVQDGVVALSLDVNRIKIGISLRANVACFRLCYTVID